MFDLILKGGILIDGSGNPWFKADLAVENDKITYIGDLNSARSHVGHNVNLHLKDGPVIVNVLIADVRRRDKTRPGGSIITNRGFRSSSMQYT